MAPFCSCPASLVSRKLFAVGPGCAKCFFFVALRWGPRPFGGARAKKKTPPRVFFFLLRPPADAHSLTAGLGGDASPRRVVFVFLLRGGAGPGWCFFFAVAPPGRSLTHCGLGRFRQGRVVCFFFAAARRVFLDNNKKCLGYYIGSKKTRRGHSKKKNTTSKGFFCSGPMPAPNGASPSPAVPGAGTKKNTPWVVFFFCSGPVPASNGASPSLAFRRGRSKKKQPGWCFFFCSGPVPAPNGASPSPAFPRGRSKTKKHPGWCFFLLLRPRADAHSLTAGLGGDASPSAGWCFFFAAAPPGPGWCFFFCCGPARTLTHSRWAEAISARPGWCFFFLLRPRRVFLDNNKKCLGYYIGSKKTRRGHSKKKNTTSLIFHITRYPKKGVGYEPLGSY